MAAFTTTTGTPMTALDQSFELNKNATVASLAVAPDGTPDGVTLYLGGTFTTVDGQARENLAAFQIDGGYAMLLPWAPQADASVLALVVSPDGSTVYVGGDFSHLGGVVQHHAGAVGGVAAAEPGQLLQWNLSSTGR